MIAAIEPLTELPGVQVVMMVTEDGVPIAIPGRRKGEGEDELRVEGSDSGGRLGRDDAVAAVATSWLREIRQAVGLVSWNEPGRVVLKGERGTLVLQRARGAVLLLILARGLAAEEVRLSMDAAIARIERGLNQTNRGSASETSEPTNDPLPGAIPKQPGSPRPSGEQAETTHPGKRRDPSTD